MGSVCVQWTSFGVARQSANRIGLVPGFSRRVYGPSHRQLLECRGVGVCEVVWTGGEVLFHLVNHTSETYQIRGGDPIAQLVLIPVPKAIIVEAECPKGSVTSEIPDPPRRSNIYRERAAPELPVRRSNISRERTPLDPVEIWDLPVLQGGGVCLRRHPDQYTPLE